MLLEALLGTMASVYGMLLGSALAREGLMILDRCGLPQWQSAKDLAPSCGVLRSTLLIALKCSFAGLDLHDHFGGFHDSGPVATVRYASSDCASADARI